MILAFIAAISPALLGAGAAVVGAAVTAVGAYLVAARRLSGKIGTSDAAKLWDESKSMREHLTGRLDNAYARELLLEERIKTLEAKALRTGEANRTELDVLVERIEVLEHDNELLRATNKRQAKEIKMLKLINDERDMERARHDEEEHGPATVS